MATIPGKHEWVRRNVCLSTWTLGNADSGTPLDAPHLSDKTVTVQDTFGSATVVIEGSSDGGTTWHPLNDTRGEGNSLSFTTADTRTIMENPLLIRPSSSGGSGTAVKILIVSQAQR